MELLTFKMAVAAIGVTTIVLGVALAADLHKEYASNVMNWPLSMIHISENQSVRLGEMGFSTWLPQAARTAQNDYELDPFLLHRAFQANCGAPEAGRLQVTPDATRAMLLSKVIVTRKDQDTGAIMALPPVIAPTATARAPILLLMLIGEGKSSD